MDRKWSRGFVEEYLVPELPALQMVALREYRNFVRLWQTDRVQRDATYDTERFARLQEIVDQRLDLILSPYSRRLLFNVSRAVRPAELRYLLAAPDPDNELLISVTLAATRAIMLRGYRQNSFQHGMTTMVVVTSEEFCRLADRLPEDLARLYALVALGLNAESGARRAGKGARLMINAATDGWGFEPNDRLDRAIEDYDRRRRQTKWSVAGLNALEDPRSAAWLWPALAVHRGPVRIDCPALGQSYVTESWMVRPLDVRQRLEQLADFPAEFEETFDLKIQTFETICQVLAELVWSGCGLGELEFSDSTPQGEVRVVSQLKPDDFRRSSAPGYLRDLLDDGALRAPREVWREMLARQYTDFTKRVSEASVDAFLSAFTTGRKRDPRGLHPALFHDVEEHSLTLDLTLSIQFFDLCFRAVTTGRGDKVGNFRGKFFEDQSRRIIVDRLSLSAKDIPLPPNYKIKKSGIIRGEVDFCFIVGSVLVNLDMKSWCRNVEYHRGDYNAVRNRQDRLVKYFREQVDPRGHALLNLLREKGCELDSVVNLLCVADVEFVSPDLPELWYGEIPRVLTPEEIADLVQDATVWTEIQHLAHRPMSEGACVVAPREGNQHW